jgi:hypothetical protein
LNEILFGLSEPRLMVRNSQLFNSISKKNSHQDKCELYFSINPSESDFLIKRKSIKKERDVFHKLCSNALDSPSSSVISSSLHQIIIFNQFENSIGINSGLLLYILESFILIYR